METKVVSKTDLSISNIIAHFLSMGVTKTEMGNILNDMVNYKRMCLIMIKQIYLSVHIVLSRYVYKIFSGLFPYNSPFSIYISAHFNLSTSSQQVQRRDNPDFIIS